MLATPQRISAEPPVSMIRETVSRLETIAANLEQQLGDLHGDLVPVVRSAPLDTGGQTGKAPGPVVPDFGPLGNELQQLGDRFEAMVQAVASLRSRLTI